jgi:hypothetical protein
VISPCVVIAVNVGAGSPSIGIRFSFGGWANMTEEITKAAIIVRYIFFIGYDVFRILCKISTMEYEAVLMIC